MVLCVETPLPMKTLSSLLVLFVLLTVSSASAAFQSARLDPDNATPQFPPKLIFEGVTEGYVLFAVSFDADGKLRDSLVLAYTHEPFVRACRTAMTEWKVTPAHLDGQPVPIQMELRIDFKREGVVETNSINIANRFLFDRFTGMAERRLAFRLPRPNELDSAPVRMRTVDPEYAKEAEAHGIRGKVQIHFYIDEEGGVRLPSVLADVHPYLSDAAVTALRLWRFTPPTRRGKPVMVVAIQEFNFGH